MFDVQIVLDSVYHTRITTMVCTYPRFIHAEVMTHRMFSRNASSSRAIPVAKLLEAARLRPVVPIHWGKNQKGMRADEEVSEEQKERAESAWHAARLSAIHCAEHLSDIGIHKQIVNRLLEPFTTITVIITATEWNNFFKLRCHKDAEPHMQKLACMMRDAYVASDPKSTDAHFPYAMSSSGDRAMISAARCARVSYLNHDGTKPDEAKDIILANKLMESKHLSPFEHQAFGIAANQRSGNFVGWSQYRKVIIGETGETGEK